MSDIVFRTLGTREYADTWDAMRRFTSERRADTPDEIWMLEHFPVFTQGQAGRPEHILDAGDIPVVHSDRGGQVTYHGPGQLVVYVLVDLHRGKIGVRHLVASLEQSVIEVLADAGLKGERRAGAPGVYVAGRKVAALGLRVRKGCSYHGLAVNVDMDLSPYRRIDPCGYPELAVTQLADLGPGWTVKRTARLMHTALLRTVAFDGRVSGDLVPHSC